VVRTSAKFALNVTPVGYVQATTVHVPAAMGYLTRESSWKRVDAVTQQVALVGLVAAKTKQTCKLKNLKRTPVIQTLYASLTDLANTAAHAMLDTVETV
jgi:hypothetical protein